jgi:hypothetical protein
MARSVHPGGLAANSKRVRPGDILVSLNDQPVEGKTLVEVHNAIQVCSIEKFVHSARSMNVVPKEIIEATHIST